MLLHWSNGKSGWELANIVEWYFGCSHWVGTFNRNKDPSVEIFNNQVYRKSNNWRLWTKREMDRHYEAIYTTIIGMKTLCTQNQWESKEIVSAHNTQLKISWNTTQCTFFPILFPHLDDECNLYIFTNRIHPFTHKEATNPTMAKPSLLLHFFIFFFFFFMILPLSLMSWMPKASPSSIQVLHPVYLFFIACLGLKGVQFKLLSMGWSHMQYFSSKFNFKGSDCSPSLWPFCRVASRELGALSFFYLGTTFLLEAWLCLTFPPAPYMVKFQYSGLVISASWFILICAGIDSMNFQMPFLLQFRIWKSWKN